jgi:hypothetical protein
MKRIKTKLTNNRNIILFIIVHFVMAFFLTYESQHFIINFIYYFIQNILLTIPVLVITSKYRRDKRLIIKLNILYLILFFGFFHYKMSILTVLKNKILKLDKCTPFNGVINGNNPDCYQNTFLWMDTHKITIVLVVIMNFISLLKTKFLI